uniref:C2H2-type domain-containing protein n=2 Tax=Photinus pyralis TaxID=7054 RepID=A0A1Y1M7D8_PHOPY
MDDNIALVKIEPKQEEEINFSLERNIFVSNDLAETMKQEYSETSTTAEYCSQEYNGKDVQKQGHLSTIKSETVKSKCMTNNEQNVHFLSGIFKCPNCDYATNVKQYLQAHLLKHKTFKDFKCANCNYATNAKTNLRQHLLTHKASEVFKCDVCHHTTKYKYHLKQHLETHNDSEDFKCDMCHYATNTKQKLRRHFLKHKVFKCDVCDYATHQKTNFNRHVSLHSISKECDPGVYVAVIKQNFQKILNRAGKII